MKIGRGRWRRRRKPHTMLFFRVSKEGLWVGDRGCNLSLGNTFNRGWFYDSGNTSKSSLWSAPIKRTRSLPFGRGGCWAVRGRQMRRLRHISQRLCSWPAGGRWGGRWAVGGSLVNSRSQSKSSQKRHSAELERNKSTRVRYPTSRPSLYSSHHKSV